MSFDDALPQCSNYCLMNFCQAADLLLTALKDQSDSGGVDQAHIEAAKESHANGELAAAVKHWLDALGGLGEKP